MENNEKGNVSGNEDNAPAQDDTQVVPTANAPQQPETQAIPVQPAQPDATEQHAAEQPAPEKKQTMVLPLVATAAIAAVLASVGTAALTGQFSDDDSPAAASSSESQSPEIGTKTDSSVSAPVTSSTNQNPDWQAVTAAVAPSVVAIQVATDGGGSQGSGVIIDGQGHILTNNHVVEGATGNKVSVTLNDGRIYTADITGLDPATDLAVLKLQDPPKDLQSAVFADSDEVAVGSSVMAMGNPLGLSQTATTGIVSAVDRPVTTAQTSDGTLVVTNAIQIDAAINPGNSGGPLFNAQGEVIGITSSIATMSSSPLSQSGSIGLGFAIPSNLATNIGAQLIDNGEAKHAFLGVRMTDGTGSVNGFTRQGALVASVSEDSPAAKAGLKAKDVIVSIDGKAVTGSESLTGFVRESNAGDEVTLGVVRNGKLIEVKATLSNRTETATSTPQQDGSGRDDGSSNGRGQQGRWNSEDPSNLPNLEDLFPGLSNN
ncbi:S1C family serine protease [Timonella sp. A28]|uniref:S1C family serine protease n=1 Tax=Timonella sp. A28 TaxID=3442640 RepID=UPI003EBCFE76